MRTYRFCSTELRFPEACVVCLGYPAGTHRFERTFVYGRRGVVLSVAMPLCGSHLEAARHKGPLQGWIERLSPYAGIVVALAVTLALWRSWSATGQEHWVANFLIAALAGISLGTTLGAAGLLWVAPLFRPARARAVLDSVQLVRYDPFRGHLDLAFQNESAAELVARENGSRLVFDDDELQRYRITAHIQDDDLRLSRDLRTVVLLDHAPQEAEAEALLQPLIARLIAQNQAEAEYYRLERIRVEPLSSEADQP